MTQRREKFSLAKTRTTIRSYSLSRIAFDALDCLFTRENVSSLRFLPRSSFPLNTFTCIRRKEWYSRCANGWTSSFFVGNNKECKICGQPIESRVVNPKLLHSKIPGQDFQNHVKNLYLSLLFLYSFLAFLCEDEVGFLFPTITTYIRRRSF